MCDQIGAQRCLDCKQAIEGNRCDGLSGCFDAKLLGKDLPDPLRGRSLYHLMSRPTLGDGSVK